MTGTERKFTTTVAAGLRWHYSSAGTPKGVGFVKKPAIYLKHGDDIRVWIDSGFGTLINTVIEEGKGLPAKAKL